MGTEDHSRDADIKDDFESRVLETVKEYNSNKVPATYDNVRCTMSRRGQETAPSDIRRKMMDMEERGLLGSREAESACLDRVYFTPSHADDHSPDYRGEKLTADTLLKVSKQLKEVNLPHRGITWMEQQLSFGGYHRGRRTLMREVNEAREALRNRGLEALNGQDTEERPGPNEELSKRIYWSMWRGGTGVRPSQMRERLDATNLGHTDAGDVLEGLRERGYLRCREARNGTGEPIYVPTEKLVAEMTGD